MANIESETKPSKCTIGEIGDVITVTSTGERYVLASIVTTKTYEGVLNAYDWRLEIGEDSVPKQNVETWTFGLTDGSTITKKVVVQQN